LAEPGHTIQVGETLLKYTPIDGVQAETAVGESAPALAAATASTNRSAAPTSVDAAVGRPRAAPSVRKLAGFQL